MTDPGLEITGGRWLDGNAMQAAWVLDCALWQALQATIDSLSCFQESEAKQKLRFSLARAGTHLLESGWRRPNDEACREELRRFVEETILSEKP